MAGILRVISIVLPFIGLFLVYTGTQKIRKTDDKKDGFIKMIIGLVLFVIAGIIIYT